VRRGGVETRGATRVVVRARVRVGNQRRAPPPAASSSSARRRVRRRASSRDARDGLPTNARGDVVARERVDARG